MNKKEALTYKVADEEHTTEDGLTYRTFKANDEEHKLYHDLTNKRLSCETYFEFQVRRFYIKEYTKSRGRFIWYSTNATNINNYKLANYALQTQAQGEYTEEILKNSLNRVKLAEELALKTNMQTYDKKKIEKFMKEQENKN
jgi:hypothetical protein